MSDRDRKRSPRRHGVAGQPAERPWKKWYSRKAWRDRRAEQLHKEPWCKYCLRMGKTRRATVANHIIPHEGDWDLFIKGELESTCTDCHDAQVQRTEIRGFDASPGADGWPEDPNHPFNRNSNRNR